MAFGGANRIPHIETQHGTSKLAAKLRPGLKVAMNLNWIPGQTLVSKRNNKGKWYQYNVLKAVQKIPNGIQAIEDVHVNSSPLYADRVYRYRLPKHRVWAHISIDSKHNGSIAKANLAKARNLASNIVIRQPDDGDSKFHEYMMLLE